MTAHRGDQIKKRLNTEYTEYTERRPGTGLALVTFRPLIGDEGHAATNERSFHH
jgi:hypothetical protein